MRVMKAAEERRRKGWGMGPAGEGSGHTSGIARDLRPGNDEL
jgi:hypothetical protein